MKITEVAKLLDVDKETIRRWAYDYAEHMSEGANPSSGKARNYNSADLRVLKVIASDPNAEPDEIQERLASGEQHSEKLMRWSRVLTPIFQEPPDNVEDLEHGILVGGMASREWRDVAKSYWLAADELVKFGLKQREPEALAYPILYLYRHCLEVYLKALLKRPPKGHDLQSLIGLVEAEYKGRFPLWVLERLQDFNEMDKMSDVFRYGGMKDGEFWVDLITLQNVMRELTGIFDHQIKKP